MLTPDPLMEVRRMLGSIRSEIFLGLSDCLPLLCAYPVNMLRTRMSAGAARHCP